MNDLYRIKPLMLFASDGVWQFTAPDFVVKAVATKFRVDGSFGTLEKVTTEAQKDNAIASRPCSSSSNSFGCGR